MPRPPSPARLLVQAAVPAALGSVLAGRGHPVAGAVLVALGALLLLAAVLAPWVLLALERGGRRAGRAVGRGLTEVVVALLFALVFVPAGLVSRRLGRDPLRRRFPAPEASCWIPRRGAEDPADLARQG